MKKESDFFKPLSRICYVCAFQLIYGRAVPRAFAPVAKIKYLFVGLDE